MEINKFLKDVDITKTKFAKAIGMKNVSSLGRYYCVEDLLKIKRTRSQEALNIIFEASINDAGTMNKYLENLFTNSKNIEAFQTRVNTLYQLEENNQQLHTLDVEDKVHLGTIVRDIEGIAIDNPSLLKELDIFLKLINNSAGNELAIILKYLLKMNNLMDIDEYNRENQLEVETLLYLTLNNKEREKFINENEDLFNELHDRYKAKVVTRQELLSEQNIGIRKM